MIDNMFQKTGKQTWYRWSFYLNIVLFFIVAIFIYLLVKDAIHVGWIEAQGKASDEWLYVARDIAFLAVALSLIFFQFFRNILIIMRRSL
jgi:hypothetical protein